MIHASMSLRAAPETFRHRNNNTSGKSEYRPLYPLLVFHDRGVVVDKKRIVPIERYVHASVIWRSELRVQAAVKVCPLERPGTCDFRITQIHGERNRSLFINDFVNSSGTDICTGLRGGGDACDRPPIESERRSPVASFRPEPVSIPLIGPE